jgi:hypothetical protein
MKSKTKALKRNMQAVADEPSSRLTRAITETRDLLQKRDLSVTARQRLEKAQRELQASYLQQVNPRGYEVWKEARRREGHRDF